LCFGSCLTAFAAEDTPVFPNGHDYWVVCEGPNGNVLQLANDYPFTVKIDSKGFLNLSGTGTADGWKDGSYYMQNPSYCSLEPESEGDVNYYTIIESSHNVCYNDGTVFFQPPHPVLAPVAQEAGMEKVLEQILLILPIGLACLVGWIALRKALSHLQATLHQA